MLNSVWLYIIVKMMGDFSCIQTWRNRPITTDFIFHILKSPYLKPTIL